MLKFDRDFLLPSGRIFLLRTEDNYPIECTEMQDVTLDGKENLEVRNSLEPKVIWKHLKPKKDKWLLTVSTQKGCVHNCEFCDVAPLPFKGNLTFEEITDQIDFIVSNTPGIGETGSNKAKIGFARMGEPAHNIGNVVAAMGFIKAKYKKLNWLPCFNSILPIKTTQAKSAEEIINTVLETKEKIFNGFLHFQISCNSTDENIRKKLFGNSDVLELEKVVNIINRSNITNRTVTMNFIVMKDVPVDVQYLKKLGLNGDKFKVKLIPLNSTINSENNNLETLYNYDTYDELKKLSEKFNSIGVPTVMDAVAKCETAGLCCGQLAHIFA